MQLPRAQNNLSMTALTVLGCGTSTGVPLIQCWCEVCVSKNPRNKRLRASVWLQVNGKSFLIDTSTDLRQQALRAGIPRVDAVLYTHPHADHIHGIDELRSFNYIQKSDIPVYGNNWTCTDLRTKFPYIFSPPAVVEGGGIPRLILNEFDAQKDSITILGEKFIPIPLVHGSKECVGYRLGNLAYVTDCNDIPTASLNRMKDLEILVLDCVRLIPHPTHFNLDQALETAQALKAKKTYLTHLGHEFEYAKWKKKLPRGVYLAYDGLSLSAT